MRHKHSLRTLFRNSTACGISCPPSGGCHPNPQVTVSLCFLRGPTITPDEERRKRSPLMEANEDRLGGLLNLPWNVYSEDTGPLPVWSKKRSKQGGCFCSDPSHVERVQNQPQGFPPGRRWHVTGPGHLPSISAFGCGSLSSLCRSPLSALQHGKLF